MYRQRIWILSFCFFCLACSDQTSTEPKNKTSCQPGQILHPISGKCVAPNATKDASPDLPVLEDMKKDDANQADMKKDASIDMNMMRDMKSDMNGKVDMPPDMPIMMEVRRFVAIGDTGTGSDMQLKVGQSIGRACTQLGGCDFGLLLGDNAYDSGMDSNDDPRFDDYFTRPYGHLGFPFYVVLGNHDLGGDGLGISRDFKKGDYQVEYSQRNTQWKMPAKFYQFQQGPVWMVGLNTTNIFFNRDDDQREKIPQWLNQSPPGAWKIAFGHHPFISNGPHGNAGNYEGLPFVPIANGEHVEDFIKDMICGKFDVYLCGHDHNIQDLKKVCGTEFIVSGAGAKTTDLEGTNPVHYESDEPGFVILEATSSTLLLRFYDQDGQLKHNRTIIR